MATERTHQDAADLVSPPIAARRIGATEAFLRKRRRLGDGPPYFKVGRLVRYRLKELDAWLESHCARGGR